MQDGARRKAEIAGVFDRAAPSYDRTGVDYFTPMGQALVELTGVRPGDRVLDVGSGRGACLYPAAGAAGPGGVVLGTDLAPGMVRETAREVAARAVPATHLAVMDAEAPALRDGAVDVVLAGLCLFFLPDPRRAVRRYAEVLRPGGRLGVSSFSEDDTRWKPVFDAIRPYVVARDDGSEARRPGDEDDSPFRSEEALEEMLRECGFADVRSEVRPFTACFSGPDQWWTWSWSHGQRAMWERIPPDSLDTARRVAQDALWHVRDATGQITLRVGVRYTVAVRP